MVAISGKNLSDGLRQAFLGIWQECGDTLRSNVDGDLALLDGLRALLPVYAGGPLRLYRGDTL